MQKKRARERIIMFLCIISLLFTPVLAASQSNAMRVSLDLKSATVKEFFDAVFSKLQISVSKALVIGDSLTSDIIGGIQYGIDTCWFNPNGSDNTMSQAPTYEIKQLSELLSIL
jgi:predicted HAD superfamily phosphohydrolase YqeG